MNKFEKVSFEQYISCFDMFDEVKIMEENNIPTEEEYHDFMCNNYEAIELPKRATAYSAGYDFFAPFPIQLKPGDSMRIPTGIRVHLDEDKYLALYPRSGLGFKYKMQIANTVGIVDSDYIQSDNEGHIFIKIFNDNREGKTIEIPAGTAFAQGIIQQYFLTEDDNTDGIRNGGFGSTTGR